MSYLQGLKELRARMAQSSAGVAPEQKTSSLVPARQGGPAPEDTMTLVDRTSSWLNQVREASAQSRQKAPAPSGGFAEGLAKSLDVGRKASAEKDRKDSFIKRRTDESPSLYAPERPSEKAGTTSSPIPQDAEMKGVLDALAAVESRGSGDYSATGPLVTKGMYKNQRAHGRYQVMEGNIAPWTKAALGRSLTLQEFRADPAAQDAVAAHQLQMSKDKFGTWEDAASVWFSGRPVKQAGNASDGYMTVPAYITKFRKHFIG
jgi:hypothetical protein